MSMLFDSEGGVPTHKVCNQCRKELPMDEFYASGTSRATRCKKCMSLDRKLTRLYIANCSVAYADWPIEMHHIIDYFIECRNNGGKLDYANSMVLEAISRSELVVNNIEEMPLTLDGLVERLVELEKCVKNLAESFKQFTTMPNYNVEMPDDEDKATRRRTDLLNKIAADKVLLETMMPEEVAELAAAARLAYQQGRDHGYIRPDCIRNIIAYLDDYSIAMPDTLGQYYDEFIKPYLDKSIEHVIYSDIANEIIMLTGTNWYKLDWHKIPVDEETAAEYSKQ